MGAAAYRSASRDLGPMEHRYASPVPVRNLALFLGIFGLPAAALLSGFQSAPGEVFAGDRTTNALIGVVLLGLAVFAMVATVRKATLSVAVHAHGLRWSERGITSSIPWTQLVQLQTSRVKRQVAGVEIARTGVHRLTLDTGRECVVTNLLAGVDDLVDRIERELGERLVPRTTQAIAHGETVRFGPISLGESGVELGPRRVAWKDVEGVAVADGALVVRARGVPELSVEWSKVPNARVLLTVLQEQGARRT